MGTHEFCSWCDKSTDELIGVGKDLLCDECIEDYLAYIGYPSQYL